MNVNIADYSIWIASMILEVILLAVLLWREHPYPAFKSYLAWQIIKSVSLFYIYHHFDIWTYAIAYMTAVIIGAAFTTAVAAEVFAHAFRPYSGLPRVYLWVVLAVVALASGIYVRISHVKVSYLSATEQGIQFAGIAGFALTLLLSWYLCSPIRQHVSGIAIGFLLYIATQWATGANGAPRIIGTAAFVITELIWLSYTARPQPEMVETTEADLVFAKKAIETLESVQSVLSKRLGMELSYR